MRRAEGGSDAMVESAGDQRAFGSFGVGMVWSEVAAMGRVEGPVNEAENCPLARE